MNPAAAPGCLDTGCLSSALLEIPHGKMTDLYHLGKGDFGIRDVFKAQHSDWRTTVTVKCQKLDRPVGNRKRNSLLKEAEVLHKIRFKHVIQILGVCNEPEFFCIVTEFMSNGSLDLLLHQKDSYPVLAWPLRLRILYEIALGVNFLHNMNPPLLHHNLTTQSILLDADFHVKIAKFGLSKWLCLSDSDESRPKPAENGGADISVPPEDYEPLNSPEEDMKHDMYCYAMIMWEVLSRQIPFKEESQLARVMTSSANGVRPDTSLSILPSSIPSRDVLLSIISCGWSADPAHRPSFQQCLVQLEPLVRSYDDIDVLKAVLEIKRSKIQSQRNSCCSDQSLMESRTPPTNGPIMLPENGTSFSENVDYSQPGLLTSSNSEPSKQNPLQSILDMPLSLKDEPCPGNPTNGYQSCQPGNNLNIPLPKDLTDWNNQQDMEKQKHPPQPPDSTLVLPLCPPSPGPFASWIEARREEIAAQMTEACLNQILDALLARSMLMHEDYELVSNKPTRTSKVRQLLDNCHKQNEDFCHLVVLKLYCNKQKRLQPYPTELTGSGSGSSMPPLNSAPHCPRNTSTTC